MAVLKEKRIVPVQWSTTIWQFLIMYILRLQTIKCVICTLTGVLGGVSNLPVKIFVCIFSTYLHFFWVLFIFYHVRCLNILNFGYWFQFWGQQNLKFNDCCLISERYLGHVLPVILYLSRARVGQRAHYFECLNEVYKAYIINNFSYKKFNPSWVTMRQILGGQRRPPPPPPRLTLI